VNGWSSKQFVTALRHDQLLRLPFEADAGLQSSK
jgi:hypothetical protein